MHLEHPAATIVSDACERPGHAINGFRLTWLQTCVLVAQHRAIRHLAAVAIFRSPANGAGVPLAAVDGRRGHAAASQWLCQCCCAALRLLACLHEAAILGSMDGSCERACSSQNHFTRLLGRQSGSFFLARERARKKFGGTASAADSMVITRLSAKTSSDAGRSWRYGQKRLGKAYRGHTDQTVT